MLVEAPWSAVRNLRERLGASILRFVDADFAKATATLMHGAVLGQIIGLLAAPLTARLFSPEAVGIASVISSLMVIPAAFAMLRYDMAIGIPADAARREGMLRLSLLLIPLTSAVLVVLLLVFGENVVAWQGRADLRAYLWMVPISTALMAGFQAMRTYAIREGFFSEVSKTQIWQGVGQVVFQLGLGALLAGSAWVLVVGTVVGSSLGVGKLWSVTAERRRASRAGDHASLIALAKEYRNFPVFNGPGVLFNQLASSLPLLAISSMHGVVGAGQYRWSQVLLFLPITAMMSAVGSVHGAKAAELMHRDPDGLLALRRKTTRVLLIGGLLVLGGSALLPFVVPVVFGEAWGPSGPLALVSAPSVVASLVVMPTGLLSLLRKNQTLLYWEATKLAILGGSYALCKAIGTTLTGSVAIFTAGLTLAYVVFYFANSRAIAGHVMSVRKLVEDERVRI